MLPSGSSSAEYRKQKHSKRCSAHLSWSASRDFTDRKAVTLSGGEMQRVALARAIVTEPEVLLLDEPTANLDPVSSDLIEDLILRINKKFGTTIIMSTHDMIQGQRLADRIGVIMNGRLVQTGTAGEIFYQPKGRDIARFVGIDAITGGVVTENTGGHAVIRVGDNCFEALTDIPKGAAGSPLYPARGSDPDTGRFFAGKIQYAEPAQWPDNENTSLRARLSGSALTAGFC